ncbi:hypothetical protein K6L05_06200 [Salinicoccus roseus]|uniref:hypothetical protein n=1 Tax=Salinicoccus roseus TaxID=45670 RepID=UPI001CA72FB7|nr:hypothetical protein [Salinicoccus roseus]MBY8909383.1 hypothetical protein [Salinicoccus roseus]
MKVSRYLFATLTATAILAGCQEEETQDNQNNIDETAEEATQESQETGATERSLSDIETDDESLSEVVAKAEEIDSYQAVLDLEAVVDGGAPEKLAADVRFKDGDPPSLHLKSEGEDRTISKDGETYYNNGTEWVDISDSVGADQLYHVTYENAVHSFAEIKGELEAVEEDDAVIYSFEGENDDVFKTFESLFAVEFGGIDTSVIQNDVEIVVGKEDKLIRSIEYDAEGEDAEGEYELSGDVDFTSFNDVGEIELPEAVQ